jgi:hypothetical protein
MLYRQRHTVLPTNPEVSWRRNVAAFDFTRDGARFVVVAPNISRRPQLTRTALIDIYREDPETGEWTLVDINGEPLEVDGKLVDWKTSSAPSYRWDLSKVPELQKKLQTGMDSEWVASYFLSLVMNGANRTTRKGLSERIPCTSPGNNCRVNLVNGVKGPDNGPLFPELTDMRWITDLPNATEAKKQTEQNAKNGKAGTVVPAEQDLAEVQDMWDEAGSPTNHDGVMEGMGYRDGFVTPDSPMPTGAAASALAPGSNPGGIDFSSLQLRYLSEASNGRLQYAFNASAAAPSVHNVGAGRTAAVQASDAFFVWLSMPESSFWVNLNPNEPDRIVDAKIGTTDVGRIMLQADFQMKKLVGKLIHPDTSVGKKFWGSSSAGCIDMRQWIVPSPASIYEHDGGLYIVDAPLNVKMESDFLKGQGEQSSCLHPDARMEKAFRTLVLPKVVQAVNHAPEFTELRRVYLSRVAAEWYRRQHGRTGGLAALIASGNVSAWPALKPWSPRQVFDQYVHSYQHKEFKVTKRVTKGRNIYTHTYTYGGVNFSRVPFTRISGTAVDQDHALSNTVQKSFQQPTADHQGLIWLGSVGQPHVPHASTSSTRASSAPPHFALISISMMIIGGSAIAGLVLAITLTRRRRRTLIITGIVTVTSISMIAGVVIIGREAEQAARVAAPPVSRTSMPPPAQPSPAAPSTDPSSDVTASPSSPKSLPPSPSTRPKPPAHKQPRWSHPRRGHRPATPILALTWHKRDHAIRQDLDQFSFGFSVPHGFTCLNYAGVDFTKCDRGSGGKRDPYLTIFVWKCGCTIHQVQKTVNRELKSSKAYTTFIPVDPYTRVCPAVSPVQRCYFKHRNKRQIAHEYEMSRIFDANGDHRPDHHLLVYAQANSRADDIAVRKTIGDIYDATR